MRRGGGHGDASGAGLFGAMVYWTLVIMTGIFIGIVKFVAHLYEQYKQSKKKKVETGPDAIEESDESVEQYQEWQESGAQAIKSLFGGTITKARQFVQSAPCNPVAFQSESEYITALVKTVQAANTKPKGKKK